MNDQRDSKRMAPKQPDLMQIAMDAVVKPIPKAYLENNEEAQDFADALLDRFREPQDADIADIAGMSHEQLVKYMNKPHRWGWRKLHPLSFWGGFLLSSAFWLSIGIALQIISR